MRAVTGQDDHIKPPVGVGHFQGHHALGADPFQGFIFQPHPFRLGQFYLQVGIRFDLALPGFAFAHLDVAAYIQDSASNVGDGVNIREDDSFWVDFNWAYPFKIGNTSWTIEGHVEYIDGVDTDVRVSGVGTFDGKRESWVLAQPQLRLDLGEVMFDSAGSLFVGIEYQYWSNKLGDKDTDESVVQALVVWRL